MGLKMTFTGSGMLVYPQGGGCNSWNIYRAKEGVRAGVLGLVFGTAFKGNG